jgi:hypothetical protein
MFPTPRMIYQQSCLGKANDTSAVSVGSLMTSNQLQITWCHIIPKPAHAQWKNASHITIVGKG